jgi:type I restriction enzyme S subunit
MKPIRQESSFTESKLGDVVTFQRGFDITKDEQTEGDIPIVSSSGVSSYHNQWKIKGPGVVIGRKGTLGTVHYLKDNYWPHDTTLWVKDFKGNDRRLVYYFLQTLHLETFDTGSSNPTLNRNHIHKIKVLFPKKQAQEKIAAILSTYDDLIENNRRRIALLEKMAEEIYREWFVRMRFPGHAQTEFVKGMPAGWREMASSQVFDVLSGGTPKTDMPAYWDGEIPFFTPKDATENYYVIKTEKNITEKGLNSCNSRLYPKDTIFITARGTVGKLALANRAMAMNQSCYALVPKVQGRVFFHFLTIRNAITYVKGVSKSGVFDNIIVDTFKTVPILMPKNELVEQFNDAVTPVFLHASTLLEANELLVGERNKILPRLISGKLPVESLDIQFPSSMLNETKEQESEAVHA